METPKSPKVNDLVCVLYETGCPLPIQSVWESHLVHKIMLFKAYFSQHTGRQVERAGRTGGVDCGLCA